MSMIFETVENVLKYRENHRMPSSIRKAKSILSAIALVYMAVVSAETERDF